MKRPFIETGKITAPHGVRGEVRVQPWCDAPEDLTRYAVLYTDPTGAHGLRVQSARVHKSMVLMQLQGVDSVEAAEALRGRTLYVKREDLALPDDRILVADLIGCRVLETATGRLLGQVTQVSQTGANDVWHVTREGKEYLVPAIGPVVDRVDLDDDAVYITPLKGIFEDED